MMGRPGTEKRDQGQMTSTPPSMSLTPAEVRIQDPTRTQYIPSNRHPSGINITTTEKGGFCAGRGGSPPTREKIIPLMEITPSQSNRPTQTPPAQRRQGRMVISWYLK